MASEPQSFLVENKPQVDSIQKAVVARDEEKDFRSSLGRIQKRDSAIPSKPAATESQLDIEDEENVSLRFLPGVLTQLTSEKATPVDDEVKNTASGAASQTSSSDGDTSGHVTPKTPTTPRLDRFIIKKKDTKSVEMKQEQSISSAEFTSSLGTEKEGGSQSGVVLSLKDKPGDISTESFLSSLSTVQPKNEPVSTETTTGTVPPDTQHSQDTSLSSVSRSTASTDNTNDATEDVSKHKTVEIPTKALKISTAGILKMSDVSEPVDAKQNKDEPQPIVPQSTPLDHPSVTQSAASQPSSASESTQPSSEFKTVGDIQTITTISLSGKNEGPKQSRQRLLSPSSFNTASHGPLPGTFPPYHTPPVDHAYHPGPVPTYPPQANPAAFIPLHQQAPPPFGYPPPPPLPMIFPQNNPQNQIHAPTWGQALPPSTCFPQPVPEAIAGPPQSYSTPRFPSSSMLNVPPLNKSDQGSELWDRKSRALADPFKKDDRDHYGRYRHKSQHYERERRKARSRSRSKSRSRSRSRSRSMQRHKSKHSREDRHGEKRKERHHSSHHRDRDRDKQRRDSDHEKHRRDSRDGHS